MKLVHDSGAKPSHHLTKQLARFRLLAREPDAVELKRLVGHSGAFDKHPVESVARSGLEF